MKAEKTNFGLLFDETLGILFSNAEVSQFQRLVTKKNGRTSKPFSRFTKTEREQIEFEPTQQKDIQHSIDLLLTFASEKLSTDKYLLFLENLAKYCTTIGELNSAAILFEKIAVLTKKRRNSFILQANAFLNLSDILRRQAHWQKSFVYIRKASIIFQKNNDSKGLASCLNIIGTIYGERGNFRKAQSYFEKSLGLLEKSRDNEFKGKIQINLGIINVIFGRYNDALSYFNRALITYNKTSNLKRIAEIRHNIGQMHVNNNKLHFAMKEFDKSISTSIKIGYLPALGVSYFGKSCIFTLQKDYNLAEAFADKAMQICNRTNDKLSIADVYKIKGIIQRERNNFAEAENFLKTSLRINKEYGNKFNEAGTYLELGTLYKKIGNPGKSKLMFTEALKYYRSLKAEEKIKAIKGQISELAAA